MASIKTPGSIFVKLIEANNNGKKQEGASRGDGFCYFLGGRSSGKSTLLNRFLYPTRVEVPKPSEGLEYTYARKPSNYDHEKKDLAHIWEVGGSKEFAEDFAQGEAGFLNPKQVTTSVVVIVVDLSDPSTVLPTLLGWLDRIKAKLAATFSKFEKKGLAFPEQLRQRAKAKLYNHNEDKDMVNHTGVPIVIAATKYDTFHGSDSEVKKVMARMLRYVAHANGAFLTYLGNLHTPEAASRTPSLESRLMENFSRLMNQLIFTGLEKRPTSKLEPHFDHAGPIMVPAGADRFKDIGRPRSVVDSNIMAGQLEWQELYEKFFPPKAGAGKATKFVIDKQYAEIEVDLMRQRKQLELEAFCRDAEAAKELAKKRLAMARQGGHQAANGDAKKKPPSGSSKSKKPG
mmetsp:Transcript_27351/g.73958  ORF Transcript_27351/g.73958 Transcript_27351/m.73958 type:complete len:401 (-) Transcript_27351:855-2057(-)|eukprot:CAMPEP_0202351774 /NCGR_PEP_ID=MMETSP1126-20121109/8262_1 /ASSEMBLY_ACC=CAM_ASM_000457 /TAXON_ID=3047 /ORGANISM="Dunaliella tertiolecta, Strain CCMP1320" /LENGTH=400 /DNA_ID=CAMNT_0048943913 /DNA_START=93 /DNA_END=1295 /DNA_ORIENTATION=+